MKTYRANRQTGLCCINVYTVRQAIGVVQGKQLSDGSGANLRGL